MDSYDEHNQKIFAVSYMKTAVCACTLVTFRPGKCCGYCICQAIACLCMMQEQSQAPALGGRDTQGSFEALEGLMKYAKARSSHQILLMTWGYVNGDAVEHPAIFPDYHAMQVRSPLRIYLAPISVTSSCACSCIGCPFSDLPV